MTHSEPYSPAKYGSFHSTAFSNDYLLKHGNFFMKPGVHPDGYVYPVLSDALRYQVYRDMKREIPDPELPLNFAIKQEKPPTPPASTSPVPDKSASPPELGGLSQLSNGQAKNATWILGKQKLSWDNSTVASYNPDTKMFRCVVCNAVGFLSRIAEHYLGTHTSAKVFQCLHCPYSSTWSRCVRMHMAKHHGVPNAPPSLWKGQPLLEEIFQLLTNLKSTVDSQGRERMDPELCDKKFVCPKCPYTTDRRDLYVRHENIHKEDKPYHCYICFKLFNRADHVKKHFLRIHRGHPYDISLVRRRPPRNPSQTPNASVSVLKPSGTSNNFMMDKIISSTTDKPPVTDAIDLTSNDLISDSASSINKKLKTFQCPLCTWEGVDSWCLRRHMNVHLKSFECPVCEFKAGKAERLFTHVYRAHKKLVCTKCKFVTDQAQDFEVHIKDCCLEMIVGNITDKTSEDSPIDSDDDFKLSPPSSTNATPTDLSTPRRLDTSLPLVETIGIPGYPDMKGSVSLMPLHNSLSYCFPSSSPYFPPDAFMNGFRDKIAEVSVGAVNGDADVKPGAGHCKVEIKPELASPVQSSSDSGVADVTSDNNDLDTTCWHCGCEFANESSLKTHIELYHRPPATDNDNNNNNTDPGSSSSGTRSAGLDSPQLPPPKGSTKKFSCAICNFNSDRQRTIIEHMRYHTGEILSCRAGHPCVFRTVCDSTLEQHVTSDHSDLVTRCPHCGLPCQDRVSFIRHYRKCHHSKSCSRCKDIKRGLGKGVQISPLVEQVKPYLHHNPYSKKANAISPYAHCNAAMSRVAVAIPQSLQTAASDDNLSQVAQTVREHKSRKQTTPRKLLHPVSSQATGIPKPSQADSFCDTATKPSGIEDMACFNAEYRDKLLKLAKVPRWSCRSGQRSFYCRNSVNFVRHCAWSHIVKKYRCKVCGRRFKYRYQVLLHNRKDHEMEFTSYVS